MPLLLKKKKIAGRVLVRCRRNLHHVRLFNATTPAIQAARHASDRRRLFDDSHAEESTNTTAAFLDQTRRAKFWKISAIKCHKPTFLVLAHTRTEYCTGLLFYSSFQIFHQQSMITKQQSLAFVWGNKAVLWM
jgi:hypothetical protein